MPANLEEVIVKLEQVQGLKPLEKISEFPHLPHHKKRVKLFNDLIKSFNEDLIFVKRLKDFKNMYEVLELNLKDAENQEDIDKYFDVKMAEVIQKFRDGKKILNDKIKELDKSYDELSEKLKVHRALGKASEARDAEEKLEEMRKAFNNCIRLLNALKVNRVKAKKAAKSMGVVDASSFMHSVFNCKNNNNLNTYTGMAGTLIKEHEYIGNNKEQAKHIHSNEIKRHIRNLEDPSVKKAFMDSKATHNSAMNIVAQFEATKNDSGDVNIDDAKRFVALMENEIDKAIEEFINKFLKSRAVREKTIRSYLENYKAKLEGIKKDFILFLPKYQMWVEKYVDIYASSASIEFYSIVYNAIKKRVGDKGTSGATFAVTWLYAAVAILGTAALAGGLPVVAELLFFTVICLIISLGVLGESSAGGSIDKVSQSRYNPLKKDPKQGNAVVVKNQ